MSESAPDPATRRYADQMAGMLDSVGFPRMPARVLMALLTSDTGELTAEQISRVLEVSPAAVSGAIRYLNSVQVVRTGSLPGTRRRVYSLAPNWYTIALTRASAYDELRGITRGAPGSLSPEADLRVREMTEFFDFLARRFPDLLKEWNDLRAERGDS